MTETTTALDETHLNDARNIIGRALRLSDTAKAARRDANRLATEDGWVYDIAIPPEFPPEVRTAIADLLSATADWLDAQAATLAARIVVVGGEVDD